MMIYKKKDEFIMNKKDVNNKENKWLVVPRKTVIDKIKGFFSNIIRMLKPEITIDDIKETIKDEIKTPVQAEVNEEDVKVIEQIDENESNKELTNNSYYKTLYNNMNAGIISIDDLSPSEFVMVMKMQKIEHEFTLKKLEQAMSNYQNQ